MGGYGAYEQLEIGKVTSGGALVDERMRQLQFLQGITIMFIKGTIIPKCFSSLAVFAVLGFCAATAYAEDAYQTEIAANYLRYDSSLDYRSTSTTVFAEVFFAPVKTADHPYAEAAFLERIGSVRVLATDGRMKQGTTGGDS